MKSKFASLVGCMCIASTACASLIDRGNGTVYDSTTNLSWMQDANLAASMPMGVHGIHLYGVDRGIMTWTVAQNWIGALNAANYKGFSDWRLPVTVPSTPVWTQYGEYYPMDYSLTGSEMSTLFYTSLGNSADMLGYDALQHPGPFINARGGFWSSTQDQYGNAWAFSTSRGYQVPGSTASELLAWVVRTGDTVAPVDEPGSALLLLSGLGLTVFSRKSKGRAKAAGKR